VRPRTPQLPWQGSSAGEGAESSSAARLTISGFFFFFLQGEEGEEREGDAELGSVLRGQRGGRGEREKGGKRKGKEKQKHHDNNTRYLQAGFPHGLPTCHHPGTARNNDKSRSHGSRPGPLPFPTAPRQQLPGPSPSQQPPSPPASLQAKQSLMVRAAAPTQLTFISFLSKWSWRKWSRLKE